MTLNPSNASLKAPDTALKRLGRKMPTREGNIGGEVIIQSKGDNEWPVREIVRKANLGSALDIYSPLYIIL